MAKVQTWSSESLSDAAKANYLECIKDLETPHSMHSYNLASLFRLKVIEFRSYRWSLPQDQSDMLYKLKLIELSYDLDRLSHSRDCLQGALTDIIGVYFNIQNNEQAKERFSQDIARVLAKILLTDVITLEQAQFGVSLELPKLDQYYSTTSAQQEALVKHLAAEMIKLGNLTLGKTRTLLPLMFSQGLFDEIKGFIRAGVNIDDLVHYGISGHYIEKLPLILHLTQEPSWSQEPPLSLNGISIGRLFNALCDIPKYGRSVFSSPRNWDVIEGLYDLMKGQRLSVEQEIIWQQFKVKLCQEAHTDRKNDLLDKMLTDTPDLVNTEVGYTTKQPLLKAAMDSEVPALIRLYVTHGARLPENEFVRGSKRNYSISWTSIIGYLSALSTRADSHFSSKTFNTLLSSCLEEQVHGSHFNTLLDLKESLGVKFSASDLYDFLSIAIEEDDSDATARLHGLFNASLTLDQTQLFELMLLSINHPRSNFFNLVFDKHAAQVERLSQQQKMQLLAEAVQTGERNLVRKLFDAGARLEGQEPSEIQKVVANVDYFAWYLSCLNNVGEQLKPPYVNAIADKSAQYRKTDILEQLIINGGLSTDHMLFKDSVPTNLVDYAIGGNYYSFVETMVEHGLDIPTAIKNLSANKLDMLEALLVKPEQSRQFCQTFTDIYNALYDTRAVLNCGPISWFRTANHWQKEVPTLRNIIDYCKSNPNSRSAQTLNIVMAHVDVILADPSQRNEKQMLALFKSVHTTSCDSSRLSRTHVDEQVMASLENIKAYAEKHESTRSNTVARSIGLIR